MLGEEMKSAYEVHETYSYVTGELWMVRRRAGLDVQYMANI